MCHAQAFCACWKPLTGIHFCLFQGCVVFWERIIVHIHQRLGNLEKTYLGDLQLPMSDVWMLIYEHDQSNTYNIVFDELRINFVESNGLKCPVYLYKLFFWWIQILQIRNTKKLHTLGPFRKFNFTPGPNMVGTVYNVMATKLMQRKN